MSEARRIPKPLKVQIYRIIFYHYVLLLVDLVCICILLCLKHLRFAPPEAYEGKKGLFANDVYSMGAASRLEALSQIKVWAEGAWEMGQICKHV